MEFKFAAKEAKVIPIYSGMAFSVCLNKMYYVNLSTLASELPSEAFVHPLGMGREWELDCKVLH